MARIILAGAAGVGKTTAARILAGTLGWVYIPVEAKECWPLANPVARQACFLSVFTRTIVNAPSDAVLDNSLLSVYGYSVALGSPLAGPAKERAAWEAAQEGNRVVLLTAEPNTLRERIERRLLHERDRAGNVVERSIDVHIRAQQAMKAFALKHHVYVVDTTAINPLILAKKVVEVALPRGRQVPVHKPACRSSRSTC